MKLTVTVDFSFSLLRFYLYYYLLLIVEILTYSSIKLNFDSGENSDLNNKFKDIPIKVPFQL